MAAIESNTKSSLHIRSNSLPSAPHPLVSQFEEHLNRLKSSEYASSSSISSKLSGLQELHDCTNELLQLPITQQAFARECSDKSVDELLDESLRLLDICSIAKDCLLQSKDSMLELHSIIRRRRSTEAGFTLEARKYLSSRKNMKKAIQKALGNLKEMKNRLTVSSASKENEMLSIFKEAEAVTVSTLESLLCFISDQSKQTTWSAISKLMYSKRVACESEESDASEFEKVDGALKSLISHKPTSTDNFQNHLENLEMCIQDLEIEVEGLSRQLIKTRVSLLNIFNH